MVLVVSPARNACFRVYHSTRVSKSELRGIKSRVESGDPLLTDLKAVNRLVYSFDLLDILYTQLKALKICDL
jgi:hypothetical protein